MFFKLRYAIFRPIKQNPEKKATVIVTVFYSIFPIASRIISPPPCFCLLLFRHCSNARKKKTYNMLIVLSNFLHISSLQSYIFFAKVSLLIFPCPHRTHLKFLCRWRNHTQFQRVSFVDGETTHNFKEFLMRLVRNSFAIVNMFG